MRKTPEPRNSVACAHGPSSQEAETALKKKKSKQKGRFPHLLSMNYSKMFCVSSRCSFRDKISQNSKCLEQVIEKEEMSDLGIQLVHKHLLRKKPIIKKKPFIPLASSSLGSGSYYNILAYQRDSDPLHLRKLSSA